MVMDEWMTRWEDTFHVAPRLSNFFATPEARDFLREFRSGADGLADVEVLAFLLIFCIWPDLEWPRQPQLSLVKESVRRLDQARRNIGQLSKVGWLGEPTRVHEVQALLFQWAGILRARTQSMPSVSVGGLVLAAKPPAAGRQRGKRQVVFLLTHYFKTLGYRTPPWALITRFLVLSGLVAPHTKAKTVATWWSTVLQRHQRQNPTELLAPAQQGLLDLFQHCQVLVWQLVNPRNDPNTGRLAPCEGEEVEPRASAQMAFNF